MAWLSPNPYVAGGGRDSHPHSPKALTSLDKEPKKGEFSGQKSVYGQTQQTIGNLAVYGQFLAVYSQNRAPAHRIQNG